MKVVQREWNRGSSNFLPLFLTSAVVACIYMLVQGGDLLLKTQVLDESTLELIKYRPQDCKTLFLYILKERILIVPTIFFVSTTYLALWFSYGVVVWYGVGVGTILGVAILRYGIRGVLLVLMAGVPQYFIYIPVLIVVLKLSLSQRQITKKFLIQLFLLEVVVIIGCVLESYVNLRWVENFVLFLL